MLEVQKHAQIGVVPQSGIPGVGLINFLAVQKSILRGQRIERNLAPSLLRYAGTRCQRVLRSHAGAISRGRMKESRCFPDSKNRAAFCPIFRFSQKLSSGYTWCARGAKTCSNRCCAAIWDTGSRPDQLPRGAKSILGGVKESKIWLLLC